MMGNNVGMTHVVVPKAEPSLITEHWHEVTNDILYPITYPITYPIYSPMTSYEPSLLSEHWHEVMLYYILSILPMAHPMNPLTTLCITLSTSLYDTISKTPL